MRHYTWLRGYAGAYLRAHAEADDIASELKAAGFAGSDDVIANFPQAGELVGDNLKGYTNGSVVVVVGMQALPTGGSVAAYAVTKLPG